MFQPQAGVREARQREDRDPEALRDGKRVQVKCSCRPLPKQTHLK